MVKNKFIILIGIFLIILSIISQAADDINLIIDGVKITITNPKTTFDNIEVNGGIVHIPTPEPQYYLFGLIEKKLFDNIKIEIPKNKFNFNGIFTPKVFSCLDENYNNIAGKCNSWTKENISLILNNSYYVFNVNHLTAYTVGSGGDYDSLQQCLSYVNGTQDSCSIAVSDYQETFNNSYKYVSTKTNNEPFIQIDTDKGNISLDFNGTHFLGAGENFGDGIGLAGNNQNITIKNAYFDSFANSLRISDGINVILINLASMNARGNGFSFYNTYSNNITLQDSFSLYSGSTGIYTQNSPQNIHILNVNSSNNAGMNLYFETGDNADIKNSFFSNSSNHCVISGVTNLIMINNTIKNCLNDEKAGLILGGNNAWLENNTFEDNNINLLVIGNNATIKSNIFNISYDNDFLGIGYGFNVMLDGSNNSVFVNNTIANSYGNGLVLDKKNGEYNCNNINIIGNTFANTSGANPNDVYITSNAENTNIWLNNFYTTKPSDSGINTVYCVNNEGNFYNESITGINETDCGLVTISIPKGESYENSINISWTKQSSIYPINYQLYYSNNSGGFWSYITTTSSLNYNWNISSADRGLNYIKIIPYDGYYNGTHINSTFYKNELDVFNLSVLYSADKQRIFEFLIKNIDNEAHDITWILDVREGSNITNTEPISLESDETLFVYVDYNYTNTGNFEVIAYANTSTPTWDSDLKSVTVS